MGCNRVRTFYVHLLALFSWFAELSCGLGSSKTLPKQAKIAFWEFFTLFAGLLVTSHPLQALWQHIWVAIRCREPICTFWHHFLGFWTYLVDVAPKKPPKTGINDILAFFHIFWRALAYLSPVISALATQMSCNRVQTPYVHLFAPFSRSAELSCIFGT